ncbi:Gfo/Idh/MocA family oxidoreductase [Candidatus Sumerlaeota bacterium]|nr:Gfo/Idh/MocA family oxidoreductase [Candidatus Sumerlaeota bacterium]
MTNVPVSVAVCGLGEWGPNLLRNLLQNELCHVTALCDRDKARATEYARIHNIKSVYDSVDHVALDPYVNAVILATPAGFHEEQVRTLLDAGKDVLVEKPLALTLDGARDLVKLARAKDRILMPGHTFLFNSVVRRVKRELNAGTLGKLNLILAQRMSLGRVREDCNALWNLAPHDISILLYWLDMMPVTVTARGIAFHEGYKQEDIALCILEFPGTIASVQVSWMNPVKVRQMTLVGSQRMLIYDDVSRDRPLTLYDQRIEEVPRVHGKGTMEEFELRARRGAETSITVEQREPLAEEVSHFLYCVDSREQPLCGGDQALRVMSVLEACQRSLRNGGQAMTPEPV